MNDAAQHCTRVLLDNSGTDGQRNTRGYERREGVGGVERREEVRRVTVKWRCEEVQECEG
jgi:hypothetical protein